MSEDRLRGENPEECTIRLEARHSAGMLMIIVSDDGAGIHPEQLRENVLKKRLTASSVVEKLSETELLEFLLLPGFTMRDTVTEFSGRGVGLDIVHNMACACAAVFACLAFIPARACAFNCICR